MANVFRSMKAANVTDGKYLFFQQSDDNLATATPREYYESVKSQLGDGDTLCVNASDGFKCFIVAKDRDGNISSLTEIT